MPVNTLDQAYTKLYADTLMVLSQRKGKLASRVRTETLSGGNTKYVNRIGSTELNAKTSRYATTPIDEQPHSRRRLTTSPFNNSAPLDTIDTRKITIDPKSAYIQNQAFALARKRDDVLVTAAFADVYAGEDGGTTIAFEDESVGINGDGTSTTLGTAAAPGTEVGMTLPKILLMAEIYQDANVDEEIEKFWVISPHCKASMANITKVASSDYATQKVLATGGLTDYYGFQFIVFNALPLNTSDETCVRTFSFTKDGLVLGENAPVVTRISENPERSYAWQAYLEAWVGATRLDGDQVHECLNDLDATIS